MKGISLPINVLVIVAIAIIVLLGLVAMYFTGFGPFTTAVGLEGIKNEACRELVQEKRCTGETREVWIYDFDANKDTTNNGGNIFDWTAALADQCGTAAISKDNLASLCACYYTIGSEASCKALCGCPGYY